MNSKHNKMFSSSLDNNIINSSLSLVSTNDQLVSTIDFHLFLFSTTFIQFLWMLFKSSNHSVSNLFLWEKHHFMVFTRILLSPPVFVCSGMMTPNTTLPLFILTIASGSKVFFLILTFWILSLRAKKCFAVSIPFSLGVTSDTMKTNKNVLNVFLIDRLTMTYKGVKIYVTICTPASVLFCILVCLIKVCSCRLHILRNSHKKNIRPSNGPFQFPLYAIY